MNRFLFAVLIFITSCSDGIKGQDSPLRDTSVYYPFAPTYSNEFERGNSVYALKAIKFWRQFERGALDTVSADFADSIRIILPDLVLTGSKESVLQKVQQRRRGYDNMQSFIQSWLPVRVRDKGEDLVWVWGIYDGTRINGDRDYKMVHEIWRFNSEGRIREMEQFQTHPH